MSSGYLKKRGSFLFLKAISFSWIFAASVGAALGAAVFMHPSIHPGPAVLPPAAIVDARWEHMIARISELTDGFDGEVGIYIKDLNTGRIYRHNDDRRFLTASLIKVPVMAALMTAVEQGAVSLDKSVRYDRSFRREGAGTLKWSRSGARYTVSQLLWQMITKSDNTATAMVIGQLGYDTLNQRFQGFGLNVTRIVPSGMSLASSLDPSLDNYTTPAEMGMLLEKIYRHQIVHNDGLSNLMLDVMKHANAPSRLAKFLPHNLILARKTGLLRKNCHDMGIVFGPEGDYVICVMTGDSRSYANAKGFISNVGKQAFDYIGRNS